MKENKENIKVMSREDVVSLSNLQKRQEFLSDYVKWGAWIEIGELGVKIFRVILPDESSIIVTEYTGCNYANIDTKVPIYRVSRKNNFYSPYSDGISAAIEHLKDLKVLYSKKKGEF